MREWWHGIGSDKRFLPKLGWFFQDEAKAYAEGLRDAMRIMEHHAWEARRQEYVPNHVRQKVIAGYKAIFARAEYWSKK